MYVPDCPSLSPSQHIFTCRPYLMLFTEKFEIVSPLCKLMTVIFWPKAIVSLLSLIFLKCLAITFITKFESLRLGPFHAGNLDLRRSNKRQNRKEQKQQAGLKQFVFIHRRQPLIKVGFSACLASNGVDKSVNLSAIQSVR